VVVVGAKSRRCHGQRMPACGCDTKDVGTNTPYDMSACVRVCVRFLNVQLVYARSIKMV